MELSVSLNLNIYTEVLQFIEFKKLVSLRLVYKLFYEKVVPRSVRVLYITLSKHEKDILTKKEIQFVQRIFSGYFMSNITYIKEIKFQFLTLDEKWINEDLIEGIKNKDNVEKLSFNQLKTLSYKDIDSLVNVISKFQQITKIDLENCQPIFYERFFAKLNLLYEDITFLQKIQQLTLIQVPLDGSCYPSELLFERFKNLQQIYFKQGKFTNSQNYDQISTIIKNNRHLTHISLIDCDIKITIAENIRKSMEWNLEQKDQLIELNLSENPLQSNGIEKLVAPLVSINQSSLRVLILSKVNDYLPDCQYFSWQLQQLFFIAKDGLKKNLQVLDISNNNIYVHILNIVLELQDFESLHTLDLSKNNLNQQLITYFKSLTNNYFISLRYLDISENRFDDLTPLCDSFLISQLASLKIKNTKFKDMTVRVGKSFPLMKQCKKVNPNMKLLI